MNAGAVGAKVAFYSAWAPCATYPNATAPDAEFYDYDPATTNNTAEMGNHYYDPSCQNTIAQYEQVLGSFRPPASGLIGSELSRPLVGTGADGNPLTQAQAAAQQTFFNFVYGPGACTVTPKRR